MTFCFIYFLCDILEKTPQETQISQNTVWYALVYTYTCTHMCASIYMNMHNHILFLRWYKAFLCSHMLKNTVTPAVLLCEVQSTSK